MAIVIPLDALPYVLDATTHPAQFGPDGMTLDALQGLVGGYIEHVYLRPTPHIRVEQLPNDVALHLAHETHPDAVAYPHLVVNEEGKLNGLPINPTATLIAQRCGLDADVIVGVAILLREEELQ